MVGVLAVTTARRDGLQRTSFSEGMRLKLVPVITTVVPATAEAGENDVMVGGPVVPSVIFITKVTDTLSLRGLLQIPKSKSAPPSNTPPIEISPALSMEIVLLVILEISPPVISWAQIRS